MPDSTAALPILAARLSVAATDKSVRRLLFDMADARAWEDSYDSRAGDAGFSAADVDRLVRSRELARARAAVSGIQDPEVLDEIAHRHHVPGVTAALIANAATPLPLLVDVVHGRNTVLARAALNEIKSLDPSVTTVDPVLVARLSEATRSQNGAMFVPGAAPAPGDTLVAHALVRRRTLSNEHQLLLAQTSVDAVRIRVLARDDVSRAAAEVAALQIGAPWACRWLLRGAVPGHVLHALAGIVYVDKRRPFPSDAEVLVSRPNTDAATIRRLADRGYLTNQLVGHPECPADIADHLRAGSGTEAALALAHWTTPATALSAGAAAGGRGFSRRAVAANRHLPAAVASELAATSDDGVLRELAVNPAVPVAIRQTLVQGSHAVMYAAAEANVTPTVWATSVPSRLIAASTDGHRAICSYLASRLGTRTDAWHVALSLLEGALTLEQVADLALTSCGADPVHEGSAD